MFVFILVAAQDFEYYSLNMFLVKHLAEKDFVGGFCFAFLLHGWIHKLPTSKIDWSGEYYFHTGVLQPISFSILLPHSHFGTMQ